MRMRIPVAVLMLIIFPAVLFSETQTDPAALIAEGRLSDAADYYKRQASSADPETASAAYYNYGTLNAMLAESAGSISEKRDLLKRSELALRRAVEIGSLPQTVRRKAVKNLELVGERLSALPPEPPKSEDGDSRDDSGGSGGESRDGGRQNPSQNRSDGERRNDGKQGGEPPEAGQGGSASDLLESQQRLNRDTGSGDGDPSELAERQRELQRRTEDAASAESESAARLNEAAEAQDAAADALNRGDMQNARDAQKQAEQSLQAAAEIEEKERQADQTAEDILNREAEQQAAQQRLDRSGGISDAQRDW